MNYSVCKQLWNYQNIRTNKKFSASMNSIDSKLDPAKFEN